jgi:hypothetical protein
VQTLKPAGEYDKMSFVRINVNVLQRNSPRGEVHETCIVVGGSGPRLVELGHRARG